MIRLECRRTAIRSGPAGRASSMRKAASIASVAATAAARRSRAPSRRGTPEREGLTRRPVPSCPRPGRGAVRRRAPGGRPGAGGPPPARGAGPRGRVRRPVLRVPAQCRDGDGGRARAQRRRRDRHGVGRARGPGRGGRLRLRREPRARRDARGGSDRQPDRDRGRRVRPAKVVPPASCATTIRWRPRSSTPRGGAGRAAAPRRQGRARRRLARIVRVDASLVSVHTRDHGVLDSVGTMAYDVQPMVRFGVSAVIAKKGKRTRAGQHAAAAVGMGLEYFDAAQPRGPRPRGGPGRAGQPRQPPGARGRRCRWCWPPATRGILLHEAVGHGLEADFNRKRTSNYTDQMGKRGRRRPWSPWSTTPRSPASRGSINVDDEGDVPGEHRC